MIFADVIGIKMYLIAGIGAALLVLTGVLNEKEALGSIHLPTVFLFAGVLALSDAVSATGAGDVVADMMIKLIGNTTNVYAACVKIGVDPRAAVMGVLIASCTSILTPMAAPCQVMILEPGGYKLKDYLKCGLPLAVIITIMCIFGLPLLYPFY